MHVCYSSQYTHTLSHCHSPHTITNLLVISSLTYVMSDCVKLRIHRSMTFVGVKSSSHLNMIPSSCGLGNGRDQFISKHTHTHSLTHLLQPSHILHQKPISVEPRQKHILDDILYSIFFEPQRLRPHNRRVDEIKS